MPKQLLWVLKASFCSKLFIVLNSRIGYISYISVVLYLFQGTTDCNRCDVSQQKVKHEQTSNPQNTQIFSISSVTQCRNINEAFLKTEITNRRSKPRKLLSTTNLRRFVNTSLLRIRIKLIEKHFQLFCRIPANKCSLSNSKSPTKINILCGRMLT